MDITIHVRETDLESVQSFLSGTIPDKHNLDFWTDKLFLSFPVVDVHVTYAQYLRLKDWQIKTKD